MKFVLPSCILLTLASQVMAAGTYYYTVYPDSVTDTAAAVGVSGDYTMGSSSIAANGTAKTALIIPTTTIFGREITVGEISSISYYLKKSSGDYQLVDWYLEMYTVADGTDDDSWFGRRLTLEPYFSTGVDTVTAGEWYQYSTDKDAEIRLRIYDHYATNSYGSYTDPFLSDLTSGEVDWTEYGYANGLTRTYSDEVIAYMCMSTGSGWADEYTGQVDGLVITLTDGSVAFIDFEAAAVPVPGAILLVGVGTLVTSRMRRRS